MKKRAFKSNDVLKRNPNLKFKLVKEYDIFSGRIKIYSILDEYRNEKLFQKLYIPRNDIVEYFKTICNDTLIPEYPFQFDDAKVHKICLVLLSDCKYFVIFD